MDLKEVARETRTYLAFDKERREFIRTKIINFNPFSQFFKDI